MGSGFGSSWKPTFPVTIQALEDTMPDIPEGPMRRRTGGITETTEKASPTLPEGEAERLVLNLFGDLGRFIESTRESIEYHRAMMEHFQYEHDKVQLFLSMDLTIGHEGSEPGPIDHRREELTKRWHMLTRPDEYGPVKG